VAGLNTVMNAPSTRKTLERAAQLLAPERLDRLLVRTELALTRVDELAAKDGSLDKTLHHANRLLSDARVERLLDTAARLSEGDKLARIVDNTGAVAEQLGQVAPTIPTLARELTLTLREAVVTLKALQQTWILDDKAVRARRELEQSERAKP